MRVGSHCSALHCQLTGGFDGVRNAIETMRWRRPTAEPGELMSPACFQQADTPIRRYAKSCVSLRCVAAFHGRAAATFVQAGPNTQSSSLPSPHFYPWDGGPSVHGHGADQLIETWYCVAGKRRSDPSAELCRRIGTNETWRLLLLTDPRTRVRTMAAGILKFNHSRPIVAPFGELDSWRIQYVGLPR